MTNTIDSRSPVFGSARRPWRHVLGGTLLAGLALGPLATLQAAQAAWGAETVLTAPSATGSLYARSAVNATGVAALVWDERVDSGASHVYAAVETGNGWTAPRRLTLTPTAYNTATGAVVAPDGTVMAFWSEAAMPYVSVFSADAWTPAMVVPADPGYVDVAGVGIDREGNVQVLMAALRLNGSARSYDAEVLVRDALGNWSAPMQLTQAPGAYPRLLMNSSGQALVVAGYRAWRSNATGVWSTDAQTIPSLAGQTYATDAAIDAAGNGYFVLYNRYGGMNISTSTPATGWKALRRLTKFEVLGSSLAITGGGPGAALIYGIDWSTGKLRASVTTTAGRSWGALTALGVVETQADAAGNESGLFAIAWDGKVSAGTGLGIKTAAWNTQSLAPFPYVGSVAITADKAVAGWVRGADAAIVETVISARTGVLAP